MIKNFINFKFLFFLYTINIWNINLVFSNLITFIDLIENILKKDYKIIRRIFAKIANQLLGRIRKDLYDILKNNSFRYVSRVTKFAEYREPKMPYRLSKVHRISKALENLTNSHQQYHSAIIQYVNYIISRITEDFDKFHGIYQRFIQEI